MTIPPQVLNLIIEAVWDHLVRKHIKCIEIRALKNNFKSLENHS